MSSYPPEFPHQGQYHHCHPHHHHHHHLHHHHYHLPDPCRGSWTGSWPGPWPRLPPPAASSTGRRRDRQWRPLPPRRCAGASGRGLWPGETTMLRRWKHGWQAQYQQELMQRRRRRWERRRTCRAWHPCHPWRCRYGSHRRLHHHRLRLRLHHHRLRLQLRHRLPGAAPSWPSAPPTPASRRECRRGCRRE